MSWYENIKAYVWDDRTTPYLIPVPRLSRPQADRELLVYGIFLTVLFSAGTFVALVLAKSQHNTMYYFAAAHAASIVWCAIHLGFNKSAAAAKYSISAPVVVLAGFATGTLNTRLQTIEMVLLIAFCALWFAYCFRVLAIARGYREMPARLAPDMPFAPPSPRRRQAGPRTPPEPALLPTQPLTAPRLQAPPGAVDTHMHIYLPARYPYPPGPAAQPPTKSVEAYQAMLARIGVERAVIVQPAAYGTDNRCTLEAIEQMGGRARGVATVGPETRNSELLSLTDQGIRGERFHMLRGGVLGWELLDKMAAHIADFNWHIQLQMDGRLLQERLPQLRRLPCDLVIDHVGKFLEPVTPDHKAFRALLELVEHGRCWVKLSAPYETSRVGPPTYDDVGALAQALVRAAPERMLWASNWPHPGEPEDAKPDEAMLLDTLLAWAPDEATRRRILVDNPAALYGF